MQVSKPLASLSFDMDDKWTYLKTYGAPGWESLPSYLDMVVPRVLEFFGTRGLNLTFFLVGQDAALDRNRDLLKSLASAGHEIGNHTFHHDPWLHLYSEQKLDDELELARDHIEAATGVRAIGFRGPGFSLSGATLRVLSRRGYLYDATTIPTFIGPLGRAFLFTRSTLDSEQRAQRKALYGSLLDALRPNTPYLWRIPDGGLIELPVTTMPFLRLPIHMSYLLYLDSLVPGVALTYFRLALQLCRMTGVQPSLLLHPLDFLGTEDLMDLAFFPGMSLPRARKLELVDSVLALFARRFQVLTLEAHVRAITIRKLPRIVPSFAA